MVAKNRIASANGMSILMPLSFIGCTYHIMCSCPKPLRIVNHGYRRHVLVQPVFQRSEKSGNAILIGFAQTFVMVKHLLIGDHCLPVQIHPGLSTRIDIVPYDRNRDDCEKRR